MTETCPNCAQPESAHSDGKCPQVSTCGICGHVGVERKIALPCPHREGPGTAANAVHLIPGAHRGRGRPVGSKGGTGFEAEQRRQQARIHLATKKALTERIVGKGMKALETEFVNRLPNRPDVPDRDIGSLKDAALRLLSQQLWNLEGIAEKEGLTEMEEARLLKLLSGFNAALPKSAEKPEPKLLSEMTQQELDDLERKA